MARFAYKGRDNLGSAVKGEVEATSENAAANQILATGVTPLEIAITTTDTDVVAWLVENLNLNLPKRHEIILFTRQLYALSKAGVPIIRSLRQLAESTPNKRFSKSILGVIEDLEAGRDLAGGLARHHKIFPPLYLAMVRVGEASGRLDEALMRLHQYMDSEAQAISAVKAALRYPTFVLLTLFAGFFVVTSKVIPGFASFYDKHNLDLPLASRLLLEFSAFMGQYWPHVLAVIVFLVASFMHYIRTGPGRYWWDKRKLTIPKVGDIILRATLARFARSFSMAMNSGVPILQALGVTSRSVDNDYICAKVLDMREGIERGDNLSRTAGRARVFTPLVLQMIAVGEETGRVDEMLNEVAEFYEREVEYDVKRLSALIEPLLTIGVALLVLLLALGVYLPMWDLAQLAQR